MLCPATVPAALRVDQALVPCGLPARARPLPSHPAHAARRGLRAVEGWQRQLARLRRPLPAQARAPERGPRGVRWHASVRVPRLALRRQRRLHAHTTGQGRAAGDTGQEQPARVRYSLPDQSRTGTLLHEHTPHMQGMAQHMRVRLVCVHDATVQLARPCMGIVYLFHAGCRVAVARVRSHCPCRGR